MLSERVSGKQAQIHQLKFEEIVGIEHEARMEVPSEKLYDEWVEIIPRSEYGSVSVVSVSEAFLKSFREYLVTGKGVISPTPNGNSELEEFIDDAVDENGYKGIYRAKQDPDKTKGDDDRIIATQHSYTFLSDMQRRLEDFIVRVNSSDIPIAYKDEYRRLTSTELQYIKAAKALGTPDFTRLQKSPERWGKFIDLKASLGRGTIVLPFEEEARQVLVRHSEAGKSLEDEKMEDVLSIFNFNDSEKKHLEFDSIASLDELDADHMKRLIEVLNNRMNLQGWEVVIDENTVVIDVDQKAKKVKIPKNRIFKGSTAKYVSSHEVFHEVRGENGSNQGLRILSEGVDDYLATEEGVGAVAEMVMGEPFGHDRQVKYAARYLAVAMALKVRINDEGKFEPEYSTQQIFNELTDYGLSDGDASETVWRVMRGTSLERGNLFIEVEKDGEIHRIPVAECYTKDTAYFEGQPQVFQWIIDHVPVNEGMSERSTLESPDFSEKFLARIGLSREEVEGMSPELKERALRYKQLVTLGRKTLIDIINILGAGKMRMDFLKDDSEWFDLLRFGESNGMIDYSDILKPKEFINPLST